MSAGICVAHGSDSHAQIDSLEDARQLDYHLRLRAQQRAVLDQIEGARIAEGLFHCATVNGAHSLAVPAGQCVAGGFADAWTIDLDDVSIAGHSPEDPLAMLVFSLDRSAIRDVIVNSVAVVREREHPLQQGIVARY